MIYGTKFRCKHFSKTDGTKRVAPRGAGVFKHDTWEWGSGASVEIDVSRFVEAVWIAARGFAQLNRPLVLAQNPFARPTAVQNGLPADRSTA